MTRPGPLLTLNNGFAMPVFGLGVYQSGPGETVAAVKTAIAGWQIELGNSSIPKSVSPTRIAENITIFDFTLSSDEVVSLNALNMGKRAGPDPELVSPQLFNFKIED